MGRSSAPVVVLTDEIFAMLCIVDYSVNTCKSQSHNKKARIVLGVDASFGRIFARG